MRVKTVRLNLMLMLNTEHHPAGTKLTLPEKQADRLVELKHATYERLDPLAVPAPPQPKQMLPTGLETASTTPGPRKAARIAGRAE